MHVYFSGIGGVGIGPLAEIAHEAGYLVSGSDAQASPMVDQLRSRGIEVAIGQDGSHIMSRHQEDPIDWFVYSSALPEDHPELTFARRRGIRVSKRHELLAHLIDDKSLSLIAVAGTHGKTTTTAMLVWTMQKLNIPVSYSIGTTLSFGPSGHYDENSQYFVYECDEYDRNFLFFHPNVSIITSLDYDHPDTYPTEREYVDDFSRFAHQSQYIVAWNQVLEKLGLQNSGHVWRPKHPIENIKLHGEHNRANGQLAVETLHKLTGELRGRIEEVLSTFPGTGRRFEKLADNLYSDYGHHPAEIAATLQLAHELSEHIVLVYQPHQNTRQHEIKEQYTDCMQLAERIYWLPTYLSRENKALPVLEPAELSKRLTNRAAVVFADLDNSLWQALKRERYDGKLVIAMGAGDIDTWLRDQLKREASTA